MEDRRDTKVGITTKMVMDEHKGWFDYASCCIGLSAWNTAVFGVGYNIWASHGIMGPELYLIYIPLVIVGAAYGVFLHTRLYRLSWALLPVLRDMIGTEGWKPRALAPFIIFWLKVGHQVFVITLTFHFLYVVIGLYKKV